MNHTKKDINLALTGMFKECSFKRNVRKAYRGTFNYYLDNLYPWRGLKFVGKPVVDDPTERRNGLSVSVGRRLPTRPK